MKICRFVMPPAWLRGGQQRTVATLYPFIAVIPVLFLAACGGGTSNPTSAPSVQIAVSPSATTIYTNQAMTFTATVSGTSNTAVSWSVQEGVTGGSVTGSGAYTAPASAGTFHVIATSQADAT